MFSSPTRRTFIHLLVFYVPPSPSFLASLVIDYRLCQSIAGFLYCMRKAVLFCAICNSRMNEDDIRIMDVCV